MNGTLSIELPNTQLTDFLPWQWACNARLTGQKVGSNVWFARRSRAGQTGGLTQSGNWVFARRSRANTPDERRRTLITPRRGGYQGSTQLHPVVLRRAAPKATGCGLAPIRGVPRRISAPRNAPVQRRRGAPSAATGCSATCRRRSKHRVVIRGGVWDRLQHVPVLKNLTVCVEAKDIYARVLLPRPVQIADMNKG